MKMLIGYLLLVAVCVFELPAPGLTAALRFSRHVKQDDLLLENCLEHDVITTAWHSSGQSLKKRLSAPLATCHVSDINCTLISNDRPEDTAPSLVATASGKRSTSDNSHTHMRKDVQNDNINVINSLKQRRDNSELDNMIQHDIQMYQPSYALPPIDAQIRRITQQKVKATLSDTKEIYPVVLSPRKRSSYGKKSVKYLEERDTVFSKPMSCDKINTMLRAINQYEPLDSQTSKDTVGLGPMKQLKESPNKVTRKFSKGNTKQNTLHSQIEKAYHSSQPGMKSKGKSRFTENPFPAGLMPVCLINLFHRKNKDHKYVGNYSNGAKLLNPSLTSKGSEHGSLVKPSPRGSLSNTQKVTNISKLRNKLLANTHGKDLDSWKDKKETKRGAYLPMEMIKFELDYRQQKLKEREKITPDFKRNALKVVRDTHSKHPLWQKGYLNPIQRQSHAMLQQDAESLPMEMNHFGSGIKVRVLGSTLNPANRQENVDGAIHQHMRYTRNILAETYANPEKLSPESNNLASTVGQVNNISVDPIKIGPQPIQQAQNIQPIQQPQNTQQVQEAQNNQLVLQAQQPQPILQAQQPQPILQAQNTQPIQQAQKTQFIQQAQNIQPILQAQNTQPILQAQNTQFIQQAQNNQLALQGHQPQPILQAQQPQPILQVQNTQPIQQAQNTQLIQQAQNTQPVQQSEQPQPAAQDSQIPQAQYQPILETEETQDRDARSIKDFLRLYTVRSPQPESAPGLSELLAPSSPASLDSTAQPQSEARMVLYDIEMYKAPAALQSLLTSNDLEPIEGISEEDESRVSFVENPHHQQLKESPNKVTRKFSKGNTKQNALLPQIEKAYHLSQPGMKSKGKSRFTENPFPAGLMPVRLTNLFHRKNKDHNYVGKYRNRAKLLNPSLKSKGGKHGSLGIPSPRGSPTNTQKVSNRWNLRNKFLANTHGKDLHSWKDKQETKRGAYVPMEMIKFELDYRRKKLKEREKITPDFKRKARKVERGTYSKHPLWQKGYLNPIQRQSHAMLQQDAESLPMKMNHFGSGIKVRVLGSTLNPANRQENVDGAIHQHMRYTRNIQAETYANPEKLSPKSNNLASTVGQVNNISVDPIKIGPQPIQQAQNIQPIQQAQQPQPILQAQQPQPILQAQNTQPIQQAQKTQFIQQAQNIQPIQQAQQPQPILQAQNTQPILQAQNTQFIQQAQNIQPIQQAQNTQPVQQIWQPQPAAQDSQIPQAQYQPSLETEETQDRDARSTKDFLRLYTVRSPQPESAPGLSEPLSPSSPASLDSTAQPQSEAKVVLHDIEMYKAPAALQSLLTSNDLEPIEGISEEDVSRVSFVENPHYQQLKESPNKVTRKFSKGNTKQNALHSQIEKAYHLSQPGMKSKGKSLFTENPFPAGLMPVRLTNLFHRKNKDHNYVGKYRNRAKLLNPSLKSKGGKHGSLGIPSPRGSPSNTQKVTNRSNSRNKLLAKTHGKNLDYWKDKKGTKRGAYLPMEMIKFELDYRQKKLKERENITPDFKSNARKVVRGMDPLWQKGYLNPIQRQSHAMLQRDAESLPMKMNHFGSGIKVRVLGSALTPANRQENEVSAIHHHMRYTRNIQAEAYANPEKLSPESNNLASTVGQVNNISVDPIKIGPQPIQQAQNIQPIQQAQDTQPIEQSQNTEQVQEAQNNQLALQAQQPQLILQAQQRQQIQQAQNTQPVQQSQQPQPAAQDSQIPQAQYQPSLETEETQDRDARSTKDFMGLKTVRSPQPESAPGQSEPLSPSSPASLDSTAQPAGRHKLTGQSC